MHTSNDCITSSWVVFTVCPHVAAESCHVVAVFSCDHKYRAGVLVSKRVRIYTLVDPRAPCQNTHSQSEAISRIGAGAGDVVDASRMVTPVER
jgi:hypothetical protein